MPAGNPSHRARLPVPQLQYSVDASRVLSRYDAGYFAVSSAPGSCSAPLADDSAFHLNFRRVLHRSTGYFHRPGNGDEFARPCLGPQGSEAPAKASFIPGNGKFKVKWGLSLVRLLDFVENIIGAASLHTVDEKLGGIDCALQVISAQVALTAGIICAGKAILPAQVIPVINMKR